MPPLPCSFQCCGVPGMTMWRDGGMWKTSTVFSTSSMRTWRRWEAVQSPSDPPCSPVQQTTFGTLEFGLAHRRAFGASPFSPWHSFQLSFILKSSNYFSALLNFLCFSSQFPEDPSLSGNTTCLYSWINPDTHEPCVFTYNMGVISFCISQNYYKDLWGHICKVPSCVQWMLRDSFLLPVPHPRPTSQNLIHINISRIGPTYCDRGQISPSQVTVYEKHDKFTLMTPGISILELQTAYYANAEKSNKKL